MVLVIGAVHLMLTLGVGTLGIANMHSLTTMRDALDTEGLVESLNRVESALQRVVDVIEVNNDIVQ